jgi:hypothetical protein
MSYSILPYPTLPYPTLPYPTLPYPTLWQPHTACEARAGLTRQSSLGYVAAGLTSEAGSRTLEYAYDDYTVAVAARETV